MTPASAGESEEQEAEDDYFVHVIDTTKTISLSMLSDEEDSDDEGNNQGHGVDDVALKNGESYDAYTKEMSFSSLTKSVHGHPSSSGVESNDSNFKVTSSHNDSPVKILWSSPIILCHDSVESNNLNSNIGWSSGGNHLSIQSSFSNSAFYDTSSSRTSSDRWRVQVGATSQKLLLHKLGVSSTYLSLGYQLGQLSGVDLTLRDLGSEFCQTQFSVIKKSSARQLTTTAANSYKSDNHDWIMGISIPAHRKKPYYFFLTSPQLLLPNKKLLLTSRLFLPARYPLSSSPASSSSSLLTAAAEICLQTTSHNKDPTTSPSFQTKFRVGYVGPSRQYYNSTMDVITQDSSVEAHHPVHLSITAPPILHASGLSSIVTLNCGMFGYNSLTNQKDSFHWEETKLPVLQLLGKSLLSSTWNLNFDILSSNSPHRLQLGIVSSILSERFTRFIFQYSRAGGGLTIRIPITLFVATTSLHSQIYVVLQTMYITLLTTIVHDALTDRFVSFNVPKDTLLRTSMDDIPLLALQKKQNEEATRQIMLLTKSSFLNRKVEEAKGGLVIEQALYYSSSAVTHNVTVPLQFWVSDSSLKLPSGSKSTMLGFYDIRRPQRARQQYSNSTKSIISSLIALARNHMYPRKKASTEVVDDSKSPDPTERVKLYVRYKFCGRTDEVTIFDEDELILP